MPEPTPEPPAVTQPLAQPNPFDLVDPFDRPRATPPTPSIRARRFPGIGLMVGSGLAAVGAVVVQTIEARIVGDQCNERGLDFRCTRGKVSIAWPHVAVMGLWTTSLSMAVGGSILHGMDRRRRDGDRRRNHRARRIAGATVLAASAAAAVASTVAMSIAINRCDDAACRIRRTLIRTITTDVSMMGTTVGGSLLAWSTGHRLGTPRVAPTVGRGEIGLGLAGIF